MADYINNNPNTNPDNGSNTLYFIVGGLVVLALIFGFIYMGNNDRVDNGIEPAAGTVSSTDTMSRDTTAVNNDNDAMTRQTTTTTEDRSLNTDTGTVNSETQTDTTTTTEQ